MNLPQMKILLIEDDDGHATLIQMNLRDAGITNPIEHVTDGQSAVEYLEDYVSENRTESLLILLDLNLPVLDGYGVLEALKSNDLTRKIPVIVLTSSDNQDEIERCYELGCNVYLRKPVDYMHFVHAVKQLGLFISIIELPGDL